MDNLLGKFTHPIEMYVAPAGEQMSVKFQYT